jgi:hypothetical protein
VRAPGREGRGGGGGGAPGRPRDTRGGDGDSLRDAASVHATDEGIFAATILVRSARRHE